MWRSYSIWDSVVIIAHGGEPCIEQGGEAMGGGSIMKTYKRSWLVSQWFLMEEKRIICG